MEQLAYSEFDGNLSTDVGIVVVFPNISTSMALSEKNPEFRRAQIHTLHVNEYTEMDNCAEFRCSRLNA